MFCRVLGTAVELFAEWPAIARGQKRVDCQPRTGGIDLWLFHRLFISADWRRPAALNSKDGDNANRQKSTEQADSLH